MLIGFTTLGLHEGLVAMIGTKDLAWWKDQQLGIQFTSSLRLLCQQCHWTRWYCRECYKYSVLTPWICFLLTSDHYSLYYTLHYTILSTKSILPTTSSAMQLSSFTLFSSLAAIALATHNPGQSCSGSGYDCSNDFHNIVVCNGRQWVIAASCPASCCAWPAGNPAPFCSC